MSNILTVPTIELKAFLTLSKGKATTSGSRVNVTYPQQAFEPLQWDYGVGDYAALLMPIRR